MNNRTRYMLSLALLLLASCLAARGEAVDTTRARGLEEVVVTGRATGFSVSSPVPARVLSGERLERFDGLSVADAARYFSGVQLKDYGGIGGLKTINVRDLGSAHVAVFLDGMPVSNARNGQVDLGSFSLDNLEEIELYSAQRPTLFQPARGFFSSSVLLLRGKTPRFGEGQTRRVTFAARGGSFGLFNPSISWQQRLGGRAALSAGAGYTRAHGRYAYRYTNGAYDTTLVRRNGDVESARAEAGLHVPLDAGTLLVLKGYYHASRRGLPGAIVAGRFSNEQRQADRAFFLQGSLQGERGDRHRLMVNVKYHRDYTRYTDPDYLAAGGLTNVYRQEEFYASAVHALVVAPWCELSLAADFAYNRLASNVLDVPSPSRRSLWGALSARVHRERLEVQLNLLACGVDERARGGKSRDDQRVFSPVVSFSWQPTRSPSFRARAFYKQSFRVPSFSDLYYTFKTPASLRPEFTEQYDAGFSWVKEPAGPLVAIAVQGDVFHNRVRDKIIASPAGNISRWTMINLGEAAITGVEINARAVAGLPGGARLEAGATYTWQRAIDVTPGGDTRGARLPYSPRHAATLTLAASRGAWHLDYRFIYTGERFWQRDNAPESREQPWYTHDVALGYRAAWHGVPFRLAAEVNNLMNQYYDVVRQYPMPGRSCRVALSIII
jgi:outer membrane cobalamin receptor